MPEYGLSLAASFREPIRRIGRLVRAAEEAGFAAAFVIDSQLAVKDADGVIVMGPGQPAFVEEQLRHVDEGLAESGRPRDAFTVDVWQTISIRDDRADAIEDVKPWVSSIVWTWFARAKSLPDEIARLLRTD